jgi:glycosyltransferase involved in cell wall biosynthesis
MRNRVAIYQDGLLSYSETFIKKQALALSGWTPILLGHKLQKKGLPLESLQVELLLPARTSVLRRLVYFARRWMNKADPMGVATLKELNVDLVHAHFGTSAVDIWPYARALNIPMLVTLHGFDINVYREVWEAGQRGKRRKRYPQQLLALAKEPRVHFLAVSSAIQQRAIQYGIPPEKITVSYIGVDSESFTPSNIPLAERKSRILYVGRLVEKKGAGYLIDAFVKIKAAVPDAELVIVGKGPLEDVFKQQVKQLGLSDVHFLGALSNQDVKEQIDQARIFCLPSITAANGDAEGLPISILEAQASGVLVVTSSSGGVGDNLIDGKSCYTFPEKNSEDLARIAIDVLKNPVNHQSIIEYQIRLIADQFQLKNCAYELERVYTEFVMRSDK